MDLKKEFFDMLSDEGTQAAGNFEKSREDVAQYMSERAIHLSTIVGEPGFGRAVTAERNNVALFAGMATANLATKTDSQILGLIGGAIRIAAIALA